MTNEIIRRLVFPALLSTTIAVSAADPSSYFDMATLYSVNDNSSATIFLDVNDDELKTATLVKFRHDKEGRDEEYEFEIPSTIEMQGAVYTITEIGERAFCYDNDYVDNVTKVTIPESVIKIGREAFYSNDGLKTFTVPSGVIEIPEKLCYDCNGLTTLYIGENVERIGDDAFYLCDKLTEVYVAAKEPPVFDFVFMPNIVKTVYIPDGTLELYEAAWKNGDLKNAEFKEYDGFGTPSGVHKVYDGGINVSSGEGVIRISGNNGNSKISVYGISGHKVAESRDAEISVSLPRGIYIVRTENSNIKIIN